MDILLIIYLVSVVACLITMGHTTYQDYSDGHDTTLGDVCVMFILAVTPLANLVWLYYYLQHHFGDGIMIKGKRNG